MNYARTVGTSSVRHKQVYNINYIKQKNDSPLLRHPNRTNGHPSAAGLQTLPSVISCTHFVFSSANKQVYIINKIFHRQSDGKKGLERRPTFSEPLRAHSAIRPKKAQLCIQPVIVRKITLADASSAAGRPLRQKPSVFPSGNSPEQNAAGNRRKRYQRIRRKATTRKSVRFRGRITKKRRYSDARRVTQPASGSR